MSLRYNGDLNLREARKDGIDFIFIKASEGADFKDKNFVTNHAKAQKAGMKTSAYHFLGSTKTEWGRAMNFLETVGNRKLDLGLAIDIENKGNPEGISRVYDCGRLVTMAEYLYLKRTSCDILHQQDRI